MYVNCLQSETTTIDNGFNIFSIVCQQINIERFYIAMETYWQKMLMTKICVKYYLGFVILGFGVDLIVSLKCVGLFDGEHA